MPRYAVEARIHEVMATHAWTLCQRPGWQADLNMAPPRASHSPEVALTVTLDAATGELAEAAVADVLARRNVAIFASRQRELPAGDLVQISKARGLIQLVPKGETPVVELQLMEHQSVVSVELKPAYSERADERKTRDWEWEAYVATRL